MNLQNDLAEEPNTGHDASGPHAFNTTNLHTHGWHISPESPADDVYRQIAPGDRYSYEFQLSAKHPAGTFWYHPHKHGSTALQLASGMSGALIVEGGLDDIPEIRAAQEQIMVFQQFTYKELKGEPAVIDVDGLYEGDGDIIQAINGIVTPTIVMRPGEIQRWRIIHAGTSEAMRLDAEGVSFWEIAVDGLATGRKVEMNSLRLYPGYRTDVLVQAPLKPGVRLVYTRLRESREALSERPLARSDVLRILVEGEPLPMKFPSDNALHQVAAFTDTDVPTDGEIVRTRQLTFSQTLPHTFLIDGVPFNENDIRHRPVVGTAEEWVLTSASGTHPFHIHVNPFAIKPSIEGQPWVWRDTIVVERNRPVTIRMRFNEHTGKTVLHCHNLTHEDWGMMQAIQIEPAISSASEEQSTSATGETAPAWEARDQQGTTLRSADRAGQTQLVVFHRGMNCLHCAAQLQTLRDQHTVLQRAGLQVVTISPYLPEDSADIKTLMQFPFPVLVDPELVSFRRYGCLDAEGEPLHGLFVVDRNNRLKFKRITETAIEDPVRLVLEGLNLQPKGDSQ
ncbi:redoxin domain-containing protein [Lacunimicrobium album]